MLLSSFSENLKSSEEAKGIVFFGVEPAVVDFDASEGEYLLRYRWSGRKGIIRIWWGNVQSNRLDISAWCNVPAL
jgi:hypothetical protein